MNYFKLNFSSEKFARILKMSSYKHNRENLIIDKYLTKSATLVGGAANTKVVKKFVYVTVPIPFWFTKTPGSALPLWALNDHNIGIELKLSNYTSPVGLSNFIHDVELLTNCYRTRRKK